MEAMDNCEIVCAKLLASNATDLGKVEVVLNHSLLCFQRNTGNAVMPDLVTPVCWTILAAQART